MGKQKKETPKSFKEKFVTCIFFLYLILVKSLKIPPRLLSPRIQRFLDNWTISMLWTYVASFGTVAYMDQPCDYAIVTDQPKTKVAEKYRLSSEQISNFHKDGFLGPLTAISEAEMAVFQQQLETELGVASKTYGIKTVRDRHLDNPFLLDLFSQPAITEVLAQLLGPDILLWRSQVFNQKPGASPIAWHQASTYMLEDYKRAILKPKDRNDLFQLTVWIAVDNVTLENGCMQFIKGTHDKIRKIKIGGGNQFYNAQFTMDVNKQDDASIVSMPLRPGQFVVFSERCVHGSPGNRSQNRRMGINFRAVKTDTSVYVDQENHYAMHLNKVWDLKNWGVITLRGEDNFQLSRHYNLEKMVTKEV